MSAHDGWISHLLFCASPHLIAITLTADAPSQTFAESGIRVSLGRQSSVPFFVLLVYSAHIQSSLFKNPRNVVSQISNFAVVSRLFSERT
ncbi:hypothetical protein DFH06DRAFT_64251 [Mycena polygramma]|nr:hypothetical protein DFH06DRAFT_64251 [Mycena polygramma]